MPAGIGITSRGRVEFAWCPACGVLANPGYARHAADGAPEPLTVDGGPDREPG